MEKSNKFLDFVEFAKTADKKQVVDYAIEMLQSEMVENIELEGKLNVSEVKRKALRIKNEMFAVKLAVYVWLIFFIMAGISSLFKEI